MKRINNWILAGIMGLLGLYPVQARVIRVPEEAGTIQGGIDQAENGDTVLVAPGIFQENLIINQSITVGSLILTTGDPAYIDSTIIDGRRQGSTVALIGGDIEPVFRGFIITNGSGYGREQIGGGIYIRGVFGRLEDLHITGNTAYNGGGIGSYGSSYQFVGVKVDSNEATRGGGVWCLGGRPEFTDCLISDNCAGIAAGMYFMVSDPSLTKVSIINNHADREGSPGWIGGVALLDGGFQRAIVFIQVTIAGNRARQRDLREGIHMTSVALGLELKNSIVFGNGGNRQIYQYDGDDGGELCRLTIEFSLIEDGEDGVNCVGEASEMNWGDGNIDADPRFLDPGNNDYHIAADSPCIDAGDPDSPPDPDGTRADMGAFYFHQRDIEVEQEFLEFAPLDRGRSQRLDVTIRNRGLTELILHPARINQNDPEQRTFWVNWEWWGDGILAPESEYQLGVTFEPYAEGDFEGELFILSDDFDEPSISVGLSGSCLSVNPEEEILPRDFSITSVYPNPFNQQTRIAFNLIQPGMIQLWAEDIAGRRTISLIQDLYPAGRSEIVWKAESLPAGMYLLRLASEEGLTSRKVILLR